MKCQRTTIHKPYRAFNSSIFVKFIQSGNRRSPPLIPRTLQNVLFFFFLCGVGCILSTPAKAFGVHKIKGTGLAWSGVCKNKIKEHGWQRSRSAWFGLIPCSLNHARVKLGPLLSMCFPSAAWLRLSICIWKDKLSLRSSKTTSQARRTKKKPCRSVCSVL